MSQTMKSSVIAGILSAVILTGCGARDTSEDGIYSASGGSGSGADGVPSTANALGSDTSAIAGFWRPSFGGSGQIYIVISDVGDWSYVREDSDLNCYNVETLSIRNLQEDEYSLDDDGSLTTLKAVINDGGSLEIDIISDNPSSAIYAAVVNIMAQDLQICGN